MLKIGLLGGLSWVSTAEYYRTINEIIESRTESTNPGRMVIESVDRRAYVDAVIERGDEGAACAIISEAAHVLERAGADFIAICCNDVHRFVPKIAPDLDVPFLHIAEATARRINAVGLKKVALLGVRKTMDEDFYPEILGASGIEVVVPDEETKDFVHRTIYEELTRNVFSDATRDAYRAVIERLASEGSQGVVLGCTELPMLIEQRQVDVPLFATTRIHCEAIVDHALR